MSISSVHRFRIFTVIIFKRSIFIGSIWSAVSPSFNMAQCVSEKNGDQNIIVSLATFLEVKVTKATYKKTKLGALLLNCWFVHNIVYV